MRWPTQEIHGSLPGQSSHLVEVGPARSDGDPDDTLGDGLTRPAVPEQRPVVQMPVDLRPPEAAARWRRQSLAPRTLCCLGIV